MNWVKLSCITGLCLLAANVTQADTTWTFNGASGSGPYPVDQPVDSPIQFSSQLSLTLPNQVDASVTALGGGIGSGDYLRLEASSFAINNGTQLHFILNTVAPVTIDSLLYSANVFEPNHGPDQIQWTYDIDYGSGGSGPFSLVTDTFRNKGEWIDYNPALGIVAVAPATITITGVIGGPNLQISDNGSVGFDTFSFTVESVIVPEPATKTLLLIGLAILVRSRARNAL